MRVYPPIIKSSLPPMSIMRSHKNDIWMHHCDKLLITKLSPILRGYYTHCRVWSAYWQVTWHCKNQSALGDTVPRDATGITRQALTQTEKTNHVLLSSKLCFAQPCARARPTIKHHKGIGMGGLNFGWNLLFPHTHVFPSWMQVSS